jgi:hypothetical protein
MTKTAMKQPALELGDTPTAKQEVTVQGPRAMKGADLIPLSGEAAMLAVIERAARDPSVDLDKFERLLAVSDKIKARAAESEFDDAMALAQADISAVTPELYNKQTKSKYPSYPALDRAVRPAYTKNGFSVRYDTETLSPDLVRVICICKHKGGHAIHPHIDIPADGKGAKGGDVMTKTHATVSAVTYGKSALLKMVFNIAVESRRDDDDGNAASIEPINSNHLKQLRDIMTKIDVIGKPSNIVFDISKFCAAMGVEAVTDIPVKAFDRAVKELESYKKKLEARMKGAK